MSKNARINTNRSNFWQSWALLIAIPSVLSIGIALSVWYAHLDDKRMRDELFVKAGLAESAINVDRILSLSGSGDDLTLPDYIRLKDQLIKIRVADPKCRFLYLMGMRPDGKVFFFVDSESEGSDSYSPPGQVYTEVSDAYRNVFFTGKAIIVGPISDRWGKWISALIPVINPYTGKVCAVFGMDVEARNWAAIIFYNSLFPTTLSLCASILIALLLYMRRRDKRTEEALRESEEKYRKLFIESKDAMMTLAPDTGFISGNPAAVKMFMCRDEKYFISMSPASLSPKLQPDGALSSDKARIMMAMAMEKGSNFFEWTHKRMNGTEFPATVLLSRMEMGGKAYLQATVRDITERKKLEKELASAYAGLEDKVMERTRELREAQEKIVRSEKLAAIGQIAASIAHEIRNPLGVIKNAAYYLNMSGLCKGNPGLEENLNIIFQEIKASDKIIEDLLEFSRAKKSVFHPEDINSIVKEVSSRLKIAPEVKLTLELGRDLPYVEADALQMRQVFYNIAQNALESMEREGKLNIRTGLKGDFMEIAFSDTGSGISKENLQKIFDPLFSTKTKGTGLGLSICTVLVERHGGKIEVQSEEGKGTTLTVKLPVHTA